MDSKKSSLASVIGVHTHHVYTTHARDFDRQRNKDLFERIWLDTLLERLPARPHILDVGCGSGIPIAHYLIEKGAQLTGVDFSEPMLEMCRERFPKQQWIHEDMRALHLPIRFDAIIGWGSFFHLTKEEQRCTLPTFVQHLVPYGYLLLTVGPQEGVVYGYINKQRVHHASLSQEEYHSILQQNRMTIKRFVPNDPTCQQHSILFAQKNPAKSEKHNR